MHFTVPPAANASVNMRKLLPCSAGGEEQGGGMGFRVVGFVFRVTVPGSGHPGFGFQVSGSGIWGAQESGFQAQGFGV